MKDSIIQTMAQREIKVSYRKLGKEMAYGIADDVKRTIHLDERLKGIKHLEILLHEIMHIQNLEWSEETVLEKSKEMSRILWHEDYRRVDNKE